MRSSRTPAARTFPARSMMIVVGMKATPYAAAVTPAAFGAGLPFVVEAAVSGARSTAKGIVAFAPSESVVSSFASACGSPIAANTTPCDENSSFNRANRSNSFAAKSPDGCVKCKTTTLFFHVSRQFGAGAVPIHDCAPSFAARFPSIARSDAGRLVPPR